MTDGATATLAQLDGAAGPYAGVAVSTDGTIAVSAPAGVLTVDGDATSVLLDAPAAGLGPVPGPVAFDAVGNLYTADVTTARVVRRGVDGALSVVSGAGTPVALALGRDGRLVAADGPTGTVIVVRSDGVASTLATASASPARGVAIAPDGRIAVVHVDGSVDVVDGTGEARVVATAGTLVTPGAITWDGRGGLAVVDGEQVRTLTIG